jgi:hypothetical protein
MQLVYFVIGGDPKYRELLEFCINTIKCWPENDSIDILVMCDEDYYPNISHLPVNFHITGPNATPAEVSIRKTEIFTVDGLDKYDKILYLDSDIIVRGPLSNLFNIVQDQTKLYVKEEGWGHTEEFWSRADDPYDAATLARFRDRGIRCFNCGQFAFINSSEIRSHFTNVMKEIKDKYDPEVHFYEQVFMNNYFCKNEKILYDISNECELVDLANFSEGPKTSATVVHFPNTQTRAQDKLFFMKQSHLLGLNSKKLAVIETRNDLAAVLAVPADPVLAEIGVFKGEYAQILFNTFKPSKLTLIDPWSPEPICSGDQDGNNVVYIHGDELAAHVTKLFEFENKIEIQRKSSNEVVLPDASLNLIYIDGDHSYEGAQTDLRLAEKWVKYGGWICGHDICMNPEKTQNHYDFGVARAVNEFCVNTGRRVWLLARDGCVSYAIRK